MIIPESASKANINLINLLQDHPTLYDAKPYDASLLNERINLAAQCIYRIKKTKNDQNNHTSLLNKNYVFSQNESLNCRHQEAIKIDKKLNLAVEYIKRIKNAKSGQNYKAKLFNENRNYLENENFQQATESICHSQISQATVLDDKLNSIVDKIKIIKMIRNINTKHFNKGHETEEVPLKPLINEFTHNEKLNRLILSKLQSYVDNTESKSNALRFHLSESPSNDIFQDDAINNMIDYMASQTKEIERIQNDLQLLVRTFEKYNASHFLLKQNLKNLKK
jgi:uncharacterized coiled-coil protein SlyX